tara:strand:+ start:2615 stop:3517 length:903 start_codon:yes stop_codon:yes gene_type:complete
MSLSIEPTTSCNLRCPQCPSGLRSFSRDTGMLQKEVYEKVIDELHPYLSFLTFYFQGEPYLNPLFFNMVEYASKKNIFTHTSTNAHYLNEKNSLLTVQSGLDQIIISIDGFSEETYTKYRIGGSLEKVLQGTKNLVKAKKKLRSDSPNIIWQFIAFDHNLHEIPFAKKVAKEYDVNQLKIKTAQIYNFEEGNELIPKNNKWARYRKVGGKYEIKNKLLNHCWRMWQSAVITWDGIMVPCCFDKDAKYQMGNVLENKVKEIWQNGQYQSFRKLILKSRKNIDICKNCTEGTKIWMNGLTQQ